MEQIIWLVILVLIWIVPGILRASAKKKKAAALQSAKQNSSSVQRSHTSVKKSKTSSSEVEKMLERLLGVESTQDNESDFEINQAETEVNPVKSYSGKVETLSFDGLIAKGQESNMDDWASTSKKNVEKNINPYIKDFDLKKAVIYSEILTPKYF